MKRAISCLVMVLAAGAISISAAANEAEPAAPEPICPVTEPQDAAEQAVPLTTCWDCSVVFADCMDDCYEVGGGPACKNPCLWAWLDCKADCTD
jgi:hypothetical protein